MMRGPRRTQALGAFAATLAVSGCGGSSPTKTVTAAAKTVTITANPATQTNPAQGHDYPSAFSSSFLRACARHTTTSRCVCALKHIQSHVPYVTVLQEAQAGTFVQSAEYRLAVTSCATQ